jgi:diadenosine tetraphosphatase ApaH/serine/threonine PP2A family protein phosphatase
MRTLILADIHSNIEALDAVLFSAATLNVDRTVVLGDLVGYNGAPTEVLRRLESLAPVMTVRGNHDKVCAGLEPAVVFSPLAREAIEWTRGHLAQPFLTRLAELPKGPLQLDDTIELCHGAPFDEDFYVHDTFDAKRALESMSTRICLNAHTHVPAIYRATALSVRDETPFDLLVPETAIVPWPEKGRLLINVGSVGQPRDGDPRAAFGVIDDGQGTIELRRVAYNITGAQRRILAAGLPVYLAERLDVGY